MQVHLERLQLMAENGFCLPYIRANAFSLARWILALTGDGLGMWWKGALEEREGCHLQKAKNAIDYFLLFFQPGQQSIK